jgi:TorA maturation chaperone TorD
MAALIRRTCGTAPINDAVFFERHLRPWGRRFCRDLERCETAMFYRPVGTLGRVVMEIEAAAFALPE